MTSKYASDFPLPGGVDQYYVTLLKLLRYARDAQTSHEGLVDWIGRTFHATGVTAVSGYLNSVYRMGLLSTKDKTVRPTPEGLSLIDKADRSDEEAQQDVLTLKLRDVEGYDVLLKLLQNGAKTFDELKTSLIDALNVDWKSPNQTMFRLNWLRSLGLSERDGRQYHLTSRGISAAQQVAPLNVTPTTSAPSIPKESLSNSPILETALQISQGLAQAAVNGGTGGALELAAVKAFAFLGFDTQHLGGAGNPDVVATAPMGDREYRLLIETKSRSSGVINQNDVNFQALIGHKTMAGADHTVVLGMDFAGGNLETWAIQYSVRLLKIDELRQVLLAHAEAVIPLDVLRRLFMGGGATDETILSEALTASENTKVSMSLARHVYDAVRTFQDEEAPLNAHSLFFILGREYALQSIENAISLLTSDLMCALGRIEQGGLYTRITPNALDQKLRQFLDVVGCPGRRQAINQAAGTATV